MHLSDFVPFYHQLTPSQQTLVELQSFQITLQPEELHGDMVCMGLFFVLSGQIRSFVRSLDGKELTIFRLLESDGCVLGAKCSLKNMSFDLLFEAELPTTLLVIPNALYLTLQEQNMAVKDFSLAMLSMRLSEVMWVVEQFVFDSLDQRVAGVLLQYQTLQQSSELSLTHEELANQIGTAREVVTRTLNYFSKEGILALSRKKIAILDERRLLAIAK